MERLLAAIVLFLCGPLAMPQDTKAADLQFLEGVWTPSISDCTEFLEGLPDDKIDLRGPGSSQMTLIAGGQLTQYVDGEPFGCDFGTATARQGNASASLTCHDQGETFDHVELRVQLQGRSGVFKWFNFGDATPITQTLHHCSSISDLSRRFAGHWSFDRQTCSASASYAEGSVTFRKRASQEMSLILDPARKEDIPQTNFTALVTVDDTPPIQGTASVVEDQITISIGPYQSRAKTIREGFGLTIEKVGDSSPGLFWIDMPLLGSSQAMSFLERCEPEAGSAADVAASSSRLTFELFPGIDSPGGDYRTIKRTTLDVCKASCATQDRCVAFTYNRNAEWCFLKEKLSPPRKVAFAISGTKSTELKDPKFGFRANPWVGGPRYDDNQVFTGCSMSVPIDAKTTFSFVIPVEGTLAMHLKSSRWKLKDRVFFEASGTVDTSQFLALDGMSFGTDSIVLSPREMYDLESTIRSGKFLDLAFQGTNLRVGLTNISVALDNLHQCVSDSGRRVGIRAVERTLPGKQETEKLGQGR